MYNKFIMLDNNYSITRDKSSDRLFMSMNSDYNYLNCEITGIYNGVLFAKYIDPNENKDIDFESIEKDNKIKLYNIEKEKNGTIKLDISNNGEKIIIDKFYINNDKTNIVVELNNKFIKLDVDEKNLRKINSFKNNLEDVISLSNQEFHYYNSVNENTNLIIISPYTKLNADIFSQIDIEDTSYNKSLHFNFDTIEDDGKLILHFKNENKLEIESGTNYFVEKRIKNENNNQKESIEYNIYLKKDNRLIDATFVPKQNDDNEKKIISILDSKIDNQYKEKETLDDFKKISLKISEIKSDKILLVDQNASEKDAKIEIQDFYLVDKKNDGYHIVVNKFDNFLSDIKLTDEEYKKICENFKDKLIERDFLESNNDVGVSYTSKYSIDNKYVQTLEINHNNYDYILNDKYGDSVNNKTIQGAFINNENKHVFIINEYDKISLITSDNIVDKDGNVLSDNDLENIVDWVNLNDNFNSNNKIFIKSDDFVSINGTCNFMFNENLTKNNTLENVSFDGKFINAELFLNNEKTFVQLDNVNIIDESNRVIQAQLNGDFRYFVVNTIENDKTFKDFVEILDKNKDVENFEDSEKFLRNVKFQKDVKQFKSDNGEVKYEEQVVLSAINKYNQSVKINLNENDKVYLEIGILIHNDKVYYMNDCFLKNTEKEYDYSEYRNAIPVNDYIFEVIPPDNQDAKPTLLSIKNNDITLIDEIKSFDENLSFNCNIGGKELNIENIELFDKENRIIIGTVENKTKYFLVSETDIRKFNEFIKINEMNELKENNIKVFETEKGDIYFQEIKNFSHSVIDLESKKIFDLKGKSYELNDTSLFNLNKFMNYEKKEAILLEPKIDFSKNMNSFKYKESKRENLFIDDVKLIDKENRIIYGKIEDEYKYFSVGLSDKEKFEQFIDSNGLNEENEGIKINMKTREIGDNNDIVHNIDACRINEELQCFETTKVIEKNIHIDDVQLINEKDNILYGKIGNEYKYFSVHNDDKKEFEAFIKNNKLEENNFEDINFKKEGKHLLSVDKKVEIKIFNENFNNDLENIKKINLEYVSNISDNNIFLKDWQLNIIGSKVVIKGDIKERDGNILNVKSVVENVGVEKDNFYVMIKDKDGIDNKVFLSVPNEQQALKMESYNNNFKLMFDNYSQKAANLELHNFKNITDENIKNYRNLFDKNVILFQLHEKEGVYIVKDNEFINLNNRNERYNFKEIVKNGEIENEIILGRSDLNNFMKNYSNNVYKEPNVSIINGNTVELKFQDDLSFKYKGDNINKEFNLEKVGEQDFGKVLNSEEKNEIYNKMILSMKDYNVLIEQVKDLTKNNSYSEEFKNEVIKKDLIVIEKNSKSIQEKINILNIEKELSDENKLKYCKDIVDHVSTIKEFITNIKEKEKSYNEIIDLNNKFEAIIDRVKNNEEQNFSFYNSEIFAQKIITKDMIKQLREQDFSTSKVIDISSNLQELSNKNEQINNNVIDKINSVENIEYAKKDIKMIFSRISKYQNENTSDDFNKLKESIDNDLRQLKKDNDKYVDNLTKNDINSFINDINENIDKIYKKYHIDYIKSDTIKMKNEDLALVKDSSLKLEYIKEFSQKKNIELSSDIKEVSDKLDKIYEKQELKKDSNLLTKNLTEKYMNNFMSDVNENIDKIYRKYDIDKVNSEFVKMKHKDIDIIKDSNLKLEYMRDYLRSNNHDKNDQDYKDLKENVKNCSHKLNEIIRAIDSVENKEIRSDLVKLDKVYEKHVLEKDGNLSLKNLSENDVNSFMNDINKNIEKIYKKYHIEDNNSKDVTKELSIKMKSGDLDKVKDSYLKLECVKEFSQQNNIELSDKIKEASDKLDNIIERIDNKEKIIDMNLDNSNKEILNVKNIEKDSEKILENAKELEALVKAKAEEKRIENENKNNEIYNE